MISCLLYVLTGFLPCRLIKKNGAPYLERYYLFTSPFSGRIYYLHRFVERDGDDALHDHPWHHSESFVLSGGYVERTATVNKRIFGTDKNPGAEHFLTLKTSRNVVKRFSWNRIPGDKFHQIVSVEPGTWTLFRHSGKWRAWGFVTRFFPPAANDSGEDKIFIWRPFVSSSFTPHWWKSYPRGWRAGRESLIR